MNISKETSLFLAAAVSAVCLTACGGGSESAAETEAVPAAEAADENITGETKT